MNRRLSLRQYILLLILAPPIGAFLICTAEHIQSRYKILAAVYCAAVFLIILTLRLPAGEIHIDAQPLN